MTYYRNLLAVAAVAVFYTNVSIYANQFIPGAVPVWWILAFGLLLAPLLVTQKTTWNALHSPVVLWCFGYAWVTIMWYFQSSQLELPWQETRWRFLSIISVMCFLFLFWDAGAIRSARKAILAATLFGVAVNIYEVFVPLSFSAVYGRSAGLYHNPNEAGEILVLGMILCVTLLPVCYRGPFIMLTGIGVVVTFSRAGILAWLIATMAFILAGRVDVKKLLVWSFMGFVGIVLLSEGGQLFKTLGMIDILEKNTDLQERLLWFTDPSGVPDDSQWAREYAAQRAWEEIADQPWIGSGTGSSLGGGFTIATHNQYLSYIQDHGLFVGAAILPLLALAVIWGACGESRSLALIFGCTVMWQGLFSHGILDIQERVLLVALMAAMAWTSRSSEVEMTMAMQKDKGQVDAASLLPESQPFRSST